MSAQETILVAAGVVLGLSFGSFANVVIYRVPRGESVVAPRSRCPSCGTELTALENIPVLSWLALRGRCRTCRVPISVRYPLVEAITAVLFVVAVMRVPRATDLIAYWPVLWVLVVLSMIDLDHKLLPNAVVYPATGVAVALFAIAAAAGPDFGVWFRALAAGACSFAFFLILALISPSGMGMGDVKLSALLGMAMGYLDRAVPRVFTGFFLAFLLGSIVGIALMVVRRGGRKTQIPFGPFLAAGTVLAIFWGADVARIWTRS